MGLLEYLTDPDHWQAVGAITPVEAAQEMFDLIDTAYANSENGGCGIAIDAPFWDDSSGDDSPATAPADEQTWFGVWDGETFVESLSYWLVTAFLMSGVSEGAAIEFITPLRTFRLTLRKNPHGAKLLVLMDSNIFQLVDLFSATDEVTTVDIVSPGSTLMLVHSGEHNPDATPDSDGHYVVNVIKSQLAESDVLPSNIRYTDTDPPVFQTTVNGTDYVDAPQADPRYNPTWLKPPLAAYTGIECDVAARMTAQLEATLTIFFATVDAAQFATGIMALLVAVIEPVGWLLDLLILAANTLADIGEADIAAAFTAGVYDDIRCTFSCYIQTNGQITQAALNAAYDTIKADHAGVVATTIDVLRLLYGDVAMCNAGVVRDETGDCSGCASCDWIIEYDFTGGNVHGFTCFVSGGQVRGSFVGDHFVMTGIPTLQVMLLFKDFAGFAITGWSTYGDCYHGTGIGNAVQTYDVTVLANPPTVVFEQEVAMFNTSPAAWIQRGSVGFTTTAGFSLQIVGDGNGTGFFNLYKLRIAGTGTPPNDGIRASSLT